MKKFFGPFLIFAGFLALYIFTLAPSVPLQGDAGELITVAYTLGIAHPPGYPLYTVLAHLFTYIPIYSVAWRVNLFSALTSALTLVFVYLIILKITKNKLAAIGTAVVLGLSQTFWLYSIVAEVFSLNNLFVVLIIYLALQKRYSLLALTIGLSLSNHHTIILIAPALLYLLWPVRTMLTRPPLVKPFARAKFIILNLLLIILGLLPYLYFVVRAKTAIMPVAWSYPDSLKSLISLVSRADYGSLAPALGIDPALATLAQKAKQVTTFWSYTLEDFLWVSLPVFLIGLIYGLKKYFRLTVFSLLAYFISGIVFLTYANFPLHDQTAYGLVAVERFYLLPDLFFALTIGLGLGFLGKLGKLGRSLVAVGIFFWGAFLVIFNFGIVNQRDNFRGLILGRSILDSAAPKSILLVQGDIPTLVTQYVRYGENYQPGVELLTPNQPGPFNRYRYLQKVFPDLDWSASHSGTVTDFIKYNYDKIPIYSFGPLGVSLPNVVSSPSGLLSTFSSTKPDFAVWKETNQLLVATYQLPTPGTTLADYSLLWYYARMFSYLGSTCALNNDDCAVEYFSQALKLDPNQIKIHYALAKAYEQKGDCAAAEKEYLTVYALNSQATFVENNLVNLARNCFKDETRIKGYQMKMGGSKSPPGVPLEGL